MGMLKEFKEFVMKGNVVDLAVAVIIGGAFGKIVTSLVQDILMPLVGFATGGISFVDKFYAFDGKKYVSLEDAKKAGTGVFAYGNFIQSIFDFLIIAFCIFILIRALNNIRKKQADAPAAPTAPIYYREIADGNKRCTAKALAFTNTLRDAHTKTNFMKKMAICIILIGNMICVTAQDPTVSDIQKEAERKSEKDSLSDGVREGVFALSSWPGQQ